MNETKKRLLPRAGTNARIVLDYVRRHPDADLAEIAIHAGVKEHLARKWLFELRREGWVERIEPPPGVIQGSWRYVDESA